MAWIQIVPFECRPAAPRTPSKFDSETSSAWEDYAVAMYDQAEIATNGYFLNKRGMQAWRDGRLWSVIVIMSNKALTRAYASEELTDWLESHPFVNLTAYRRQWRAGLREDKALAMEGNN